MGIQRPELSACEPIPGVLRGCREAGISRVERCLLYAPDAIGRQVIDRYPEVIRTIREAAPVMESLRSVFPPKTPVCFASMLTGGAPETHGITSYERPVLECDTLFDALIRAGKKPAIVSVKDASVDVIFRGRGMDYFSEPCDGDVTARALELIEAGRHDLILAYQQEYDDTLHESGTYSPAAVAAVWRHVDAFTELVNRARECRGGGAGLVAFVPDHGAHDDPDTGTGTHGDDIADDMEVVHFFGFVK